MVRNLFVLSLLSFAVAGCMGPKKGPSPVTDGAGDGNLVPTTLAPVAAAPAAPVLTPDPAPAPAAPAAKKGAAKSKGKLPLNSTSNK